MFYSGNSIVSKRLFGQLRICIVIFFLFISIGKLSSIDVSVNHACFQNQETAYLEVYLHIFANSVSGFPESESGVKTLIMIKQGSDVVNFEKFKLGFTADSTTSNFVELRRFALPTGDYTLEIEMTDIKDSTNKFLFSQAVHIQFEPIDFYQSDLLLLSSLEKGEPDHPLYKQGYLMEDVAFNYYYDAFRSLFFYNELYNLSSLPEDTYFYTYSIHEQYAGEGGKKIREAHKRLHYKSKENLLHEIKIDDLPSGNYHLKLEVKNSKKEIISQRTKNFQRSNPNYDLSIEISAESNFEYSFVQDIPLSELDYNLKAIVPRLSDESSEGLYYVLTKGNEQSKRYYLFRFWTSMNKDQPKAAFQQYMKIARAVDKSFFSGFGYGFETDRGRVFLKYGKPNELIAVEEEPSAPPYEIWIYNSIPEIEQTNVKFLFYNPSLGHNDYKLLHSTCRGEINNPAWEVDLYSKAPSERIGNTIDATNMQDNFNRNARRYFENN